MSSDKISKEQLIVLIDERHDVMDGALGRTIISAVEVDGIENLDAIEDQVKMAMSHIDDLADLKKIHLSDMDWDLKVKVIDVICRLEFKSKVWVHYDVLVNQHTAKVMAMKWAVSALEKKHSKKDLRLIIEEASEYKGIIRERYMSGSAYLSLLPDIVCYIMALKLDATSLAKSETDIVQRQKVAKGYQALIDLMHEHIRLQVYGTHYTKSENARANRL